MAFKDKFNSVKASFAELQIPSMSMKLKAIFMLPFVAMCALNMLHVIRTVLSPWSIFSLSLRGFMNLGHIVLFAGSVIVIAGFLLGKLKSEWVMLSSIALSAFQIAYQLAWYIEKNLFMHLDINFAWIPVTIGFLCLLSAFFMAPKQKKMVFSCFLALFFPFFIMDFLVFGIPEPQVILAAMIVCVCLILWPTVTINVILTCVLGFFLFCAAFLGVGGAAGALGTRRSR